MGGCGAWICILFGLALISMSHYIEWPRHLRFLSCQSEKAFNIKYRYELESCIGRNLSSLIPSSLLFNCSIYYTPFEEPLLLFPCILCLLVFIWTFWVLSFVCSCNLNIMKTRAGFIWAFELKLVHPLINYVVEASKQVKNNYTSISSLCMILTWLFSCQYNLGRSLWELTQFEWRQFIP